HDEEFKIGAVNAAEVWLFREQVQNHVRAQAKANHVLYTGEMVCPEIVGGGIRQPRQRFAHRADHSLKIHPFEIVEVEMVVDEFLKRIIGEVGHDALLLK